eukprot:CAMPEP_0113556040 /NCGR_PEP_ID=MMETSP0015_2-20120614/17043_1 /TAXON_ID=2838 /ORGANISM="Odontella" /LENGTH=2458 /DNA_ID=CAMNT_0000457367 /DNA_START=35 /DNA_END=7408 /DNA_ORIENTATION=- /assembly_acc=CAM_ASM_000160
MTIEALELQHQGFRLVEFLISHDPEYLQKHNDIVRACRWLWRSKGRHVRMLHEESMPPRYHDESRMLASVLVQYSRSFPGDVDVLFDLLRVFLQQASVDFTFVRLFLDDVELTPGQKTHVMQRFFAIFGSDGTEETKVLSVQMLVLPMLKSDLACRHSSSHGQPSVKGSWVEKMHGESSLIQDEANANDVNVEPASIIDKEMLHKFISDVLFHDGTPRSYGGRLNVEVLKMSNLFLKYCWDDLVSYRKDLIKFSWSLLKSDDMSTKLWAYINVCQFIAVFETPDRIVLQVYVALLRSFQQEARDLVRLAFAILMPSLGRRLTVENYHKAVKYTTKIMLEEGSSIPQLAHLWHVIIQHPVCFEQHQHLFVPQMVLSLSRLALPTNCPPENRELSISLVNLILDWSTGKGSSYEEADPFTAYGPLSPKKLKKNDGNMTPMVGLAEKGHRSNNDSSTPTSEQKEAVMNFLVRLLLLIADGKDDPVQSKFASRILALFQRALTLWPLTPVSSLYFDQVLPTLDKKSRDKSSKSKPGSSKGKLGSSKAPKQSISRDDTQWKIPVLLTWLDIFSALLEFAPENAFISDNTTRVSGILAHCFDQSKDSDMLRENLEELVVNICSSKYYQQLSSNINVSIERVLMNASNAKVDTRALGHSVKGGSGRRGRKEDTAKDEEQNDELNSTASLAPRGTSPGESLTASFAVQVIDAVTMNRPEFVEHFTGALLRYAEVLAKKHESAAARSKTVASTKHSMGGHQRLSSPSLGVFEEALSLCFSSTGKTTSNNNSKEGKMLGTSVPEDIDLCALIITIRLLGYSRLSFTFSVDRMAFLNLLHDILDTSSNVLLLFATIAVVGKLILSDDVSGPMSAKECNSFILKITSFDSLHMEESAMQPLTDLVAHIMLSLHGWDGNASSEFIKKSCYSGEVRTLDMPPLSSLRLKHHTNVDDKSDTVLMGRCLISCILSANSRLRPLLVGLLGTQTTDCKDMEIVLSRKGELAGCTEDDSLDVVGIPFRTPVDLLWQLLSSDYEGLAGRLWTAVFVEFILGGSNHCGGVELSREKRERPQEESQPWLLKPSTAQFGNSKSIRAGDLVDYVVFSKVLSKQKKPSSVGRGRCLSAIRRIAHADVSLCQDLLERLLSLAWAKLPSNSARVALVSAIEPLLCQPYLQQFLQHSHALAGRTHAVFDPAKSKSLCANPVQSILRAMSNFKPLPALDTDLMLGASSLYNGWHDVISMLEQQHRVILAKNESSSDSKAHQEKLRAVLQLCFRDLGEADMCTSMTIDSCKMPQSKHALSLEMYGKVQSAMESYTDLIAKAEEASENFESGVASVEVPSDAEAGVWEDRWVDLNKELCQWDVLAEYAEEMSYPKLQMECAWKKREWEKVRKLLTTASIMGSLEEGDSDIKMSEVFLAIVDGKLSDVENLHAQTAQLCLYKWQLLPSLSTGYNAHVALLQKFHRLVELRESGHIMVETSTHSGTRTVPNMKHLLTAWRHRLPNELDPISVWDDIFIWRAHMFNAITTNFSWSEPGTLATLHDRPWTAIKLASVGRKQGTKEVSLLALGKLTDCAMDVSDAFSKLREQIKSYCDGTEAERTGGLNLINTTNLSFFDQRQKGELFRLKARFLSSLGQAANANQAFCHALHVCPSYARAWVDWGGLCSFLSEQLEDVGKKATDPAKAASAARKVYQYLSQSMACYLEAMQCDTHEKTRINLSKCLWMLSKEGTVPGLLCSTLESRSADLPAWVWLPWIPQLLTSLYRVEGKAVKAILKGILAIYPQALYPHLRVFFLERREVEKIRESKDGPRLVNSAGYADEMIEMMKRTHASLNNRLEPIIEELVTRFRPTHEEELLAAIKNLLRKAEMQLQQGKSGGSSKIGDDALLSYMSKLVQRIINARFFRLHPETEQRTNDDRTKRAMQFTTRYKDKFERDFVMSPVDNSNTAQLRQRVQDIAEKLKKWKRILEFQVESTPSVIALQQVSPELASFAAEAPDLWAGACDPSRDVSSFEERTENESSAVHASASSCPKAAANAAKEACKAVARAAAREGYGGHYGGGAASVEIPGLYPPHSADAIDSRPSPELHATLVRFESDVRVTLKSGFIAHRIGMVGSDGKTRHFLLQHSTHHWTCADERTNQLNYLCSKIFRWEVMSARRNLFARPSPVVPLAQRIKMTADDVSCYSLGDVYSLDCVENGLDDTNHPLKQFQGEVRRGLVELGDPGDDSARRAEAEKSVKVAALKKVCKRVKSSILSDRMRSCFRTQEKLYHFRRTFCSQTAVHSLLQYGFGSIERTPSQFVFSLETAQVYAPDFRFAYNQQGYLQGTGVPFRMTPNIREFIGPFQMQGNFIPGLASAAMGICAHEKELDPIFHLLLRDDIVSWYTSKSHARGDRKMQELERQLVERQVRKNVTLVQGRLKECNPKEMNVEPVSGEGVARQEPLDQRLRDLISSATSWDSLGMMPAEFQAW